MRLPASLTRGSQVRSPSPQSAQTANFQGESKRAVSVGFFASIVLLFRSPVRLAVSQANSSLPSPHPKIPFPAVASQGAKAFGNSGILAVFRAKRTFGTRSVVIAGSRHRTEQRKSRRHFRAAASRAHKCIAMKLPLPGERSQNHICARRKSKCAVPTQEQNFSCDGATFPLPKILSRESTAIAQ
jgi:hypothetical protein